MPMRRDRTQFARALAQALLAGPFEEHAMRVRLQQVVAEDPAAASPGWIDELVQDVLFTFGDPRPRPKLRALMDHLVERPAFSEGWFPEPLEDRGAPPWPQVLRVFVPQPAMLPHPGAPSAWALPALETPADLARLLGMSSGELEWFADLQGRNGRSGARLQHYVCTWRPKRGRPGGRLIEAPKVALKLAQRRVLSAIVRKIPVHEAAHGFVRGRSVRTHAALHAGQRVVVRLDLREFFPRLTAAWIEALFRTAGYPEPVAVRLAHLCTHRVPMGFWRGLRAEVPWETRKRYAAPHLPQGAPTSPALANLCAFRLDLRLAALARASGATYSRYADDLTFSGGEEWERGLVRFLPQARAVIEDQGLVVNVEKTRVMRAGTRQLVTGVVVNRHPNVRRAEVDRLKAILHNCLRHGPASQNLAADPAFRERLAGQLGWVEMVNPARGAKLRAVFEAIRW